MIFSLYGFPCFPFGSVGKSTVLLLVHCLDKPELSSICDRSINQLVRKPADEYTDGLSVHIGLGVLHRLLHILELFHLLFLSVLIPHILLLQSVCLPFQFLQKGYSCLLQEGCFIEIEKTPTLLSGFRVGVPFV